MLTAGARLGPYEILHPIGAGGMGEVHRARHLKLQPLFAMLGAPGERKRHARLDGGHIPTNRVEIVREVLDWLDQHLGSVQRGTTTATGR